MVIQHCFWPALSPDKEDFSIPTTNENRLKVMVLADIHLKCTRESWKGIFNEEDQMRRYFQNAVQYLKPDLVFVLGDILDKGMQYCNLKEFNDTVQRFHDIFSVPNETEMYVVPGNVEIGYHHQIDVDENEEFMDAFKSPLIQFLTIRKNNFVLLNSMALGSDDCSLCAVVEKNLSEIEKKLNCSQEANRSTCEAFLTMPVYSRPILIQHSPLYRTSDADCNDYDSAPFPRKLRNMAENWDCLSKNLTSSLTKRLNPRIVFSGHIHHGCTRSLPGKNGVEVTMSSFNWRKKDNPALGLLWLFHPDLYLELIDCRASSKIIFQTYISDTTNTSLLVDIIFDPCPEQAVITTTNYEIVKCQLPRYSTIKNIYLIGMIIIVLWIIFSYKTKRMCIMK